VQVPRLRRGLRRLGLGRRIVLGEPSRGLVVRVKPDVALAFGALLRSAAGQPMPQTLTSSFSFSASAITFCATCAGTSS
jgi:hypothetical protein